MPVAFIGIDQLKEIRYFNKKAAAFIKTGSEGLNDTSVFSLVPILSAYRESIENTLISKLPYQCDRVSLIDRGLTNYYKIVTYPLSKGIGAAIQIEDITMQVFLESKMIQNEKMLSISGLAAGMAHEINNPLGGIVQTIQNIERRLQKDLESNKVVASKYNVDLCVLEKYLEEREVWRFLRSVRELGDRIGKIIHTMLQFSRKGAVDKQPYKVENMIQNALSIAKNDPLMSGVSVITDVANNVESVSCFPDEIEQVLLNIIRNSAHAMKEFNTEDPRIQISVYIKEKDLYLSVSDNGPGIPSDVQKKIFEPFFTTKAAGQGTGLGLALSHYIMETRHHGKMEVVSKEGEGANFILVLPIDAA
ncbi:MAG: hypothetical protein EBZ47_08920 [Chlamydiae bacterium]|nr:hypothetical protein [Chlamydiota bacterium]